MGKFANMIEWFSKMWAKTKETTVRGYNWISTDGLINMETSALLTIVFSLFVSPLMAAFFAFIIVLGKCAFDKSKGHQDEKHDLICASLGVLMGLILSVTHMAIILHK